MFRRRGQRMFRGGRQDVPPVLQRANQLMASGEYEEAASLFADLGQRAEDRFPHRAPFLFIEAGRAAILGGQTKIGIAHLRRGLTLFASQGRMHRMRMVGERAIDELQARHLKAEADEIAALLNSNAPAVDLAEKEASAPMKKPILPTHCPSCGAAVRPNEVEWLDEATAECAYCGSPLR